MSNNIDNRIVQMQFENSQFEKGVRESTKSLEKFKKDLDFEDSSKSLESLQKAGNSFSLARMANGIEEIGKRFSTMGMIGMRVLQNLTDKAFNAGESFVKSVTIDQITAGFTKYADKTKSVQTIVNATGDTIDNVDEQLSKLAWFTDETSYNFVDMVDNIGKFTSMNVPLDQSVTAMQGIATWAAVSGQGVGEASRAMYNLAQAIGVGAVKLMDWRSIENANMGTAEFKETAIETAKALGVLSKEGKTNKGTLVDINNFSSTLAEGWFTKDVLLDTLNKYGEYANEVYKVASEEGITAAEAMEKVSGETMKLGEKAFKAAQEAKTFIEAIDATKDAVSTGWMNTFENIFGNYEEAKVLWTQLANDLWDIFASGAEQRNELLGMWKELGGRDDLISGLTDAMEAFKSILSGVGDEFHSIFPEVTVDNLLKISSTIKDIGAALKKAFVIEQELIGWHNEMREKTEGGFEELGESLERGAKGDAVKKLQERLNELGFDAGIADGIFGPKTEAALNEFKKKYGLAIDGVYDETAHSELGKALGLDEKTLYVLEQVPTYIDRIPDKYKKLKITLQGVFSVINIGVKIFGFLISAGKKILSVFSPLGKVFSTIGEAIARFFIALNERLSASTKFQEWLDKLDETLGPVKDKISELCDQFLNLLGLGGDLGQIDFGKIVDNIITAIKNFFGIGIDSSGITEGITDGFNPKTIFENVKSSIIEAFNSISKWINTLFSGTKDGSTPELGIDFSGYNLALTAIAVIVAALSGRLLQAVGVVVKTGKNVNKAIKQVTGTIKEFKNARKFKNLNEVSEAVLQFAKAIGLLALSVFIIAQLPWQNLAVGLVGLVAIMGLLIGSVFALKYAAKNFKNIDKVMEALVPFAEGMAALAIVVKMLSELSWEQMGRGLAGVVVLAGLVIGALYLLNKSTVDIKQASGTIALIASLASALGGMANVVNKLGSMKIEVLVKGLASLGIVMFAIAKFIKSIKTIKISGGTVASIVALAVAVDLLIGGFLILSFAMKFLKVSDLIKGFTAMAAIMTAMAVMMKVVGKIKPDTKAILALLPMALALDLVIAGFIVMIGVMKFVKPIDIAKGVAGIIGIVLGMALTMKVMEKVHPKPSAVLSMLPVAIALDLLIAGFAALLIVIKHSSPRDIAKAVAGMVSIVLAIGLVMKAASKIKPSIRGILALVPIALALDIAIGGFIILAMAMKKIDTKTLIKAFGSMIAVVTMLSVMAFVLSKVAPGLKGSFSMLVSSITIVGAMVAFALVLRQIKSVNTNKIIAFSKGLSEIFIAFGLLSMFAKVAGIKGILLAAAAIVVLSAAVGIVVAATAAILQIPGVSEFLSGGAEKLGEIIGSFTGSMKAADMKAFSKGMEGFKDVSPADENAVNNTIKCAEIFSKFASDISGHYNMAEQVGVKLGLMATDMELFAGDMSHFAAGFNNFATEIGKVDIADEKSLSEKTKSAIGIAKQLAAFNNGLDGEYSTLEKAASWLVATDMELFVGDMSSFSTGINNFSTAMSKVNITEFVEDNVAKAIGVANQVEAFNAGLNGEYTSSEKLTSWLFGAGATDMVSFVGDLSAFATGISNFSTVMSNLSISEYTDDNVSKAIALANQVQSFNSGLNGTYDSLEKVTSWLFGQGATDMKAFSGDTVSFALGIGCFSKVMSNLNISDYTEENTTKAISLANKIVDFQTNLPDYPKGFDKVLDWLLGTDMEKFTGDMGTFSTGISEFATAMSGLTLDDVTTTNVEQATSIAGMVATFLSSLSDMNIEHDRGVLDKWLNGGTAQDSVFNAVGRLAESMSDNKDKFSTMADGSLSTNIENAINALKAIGKLLMFASLNDGLISKSQTSYDEMLSAVYQLAGIAEEFNRLLIEENVDLKSVSELWNAFAVIFTNNGSEINTKNFLGDLDAKAVATKLTEFTTQLGETIGASTETITGYSDSFNSAGNELASSVISGVGSADTSGAGSLASSALSALSGYTSKFRETGVMFGAGLAKGLSSSKAVAVIAAGLIAEAMLKKVKDVLKIESPSKAAARLGSYFTEGMAQGTTSKIKMAEESSGEVAESMLNVAKGTMTSLSSILSEGINDNPTIRPVVDMSSTRAAASAIDGMFGTKSFALQSTIAASASINPKTGRPNTNQNGSENVVAAVQGMGGQISALGNAIQNMQMVVDSGALVGQISNKMDRKLGQMATMKARRI